MTQDHAHLNGHATKKYDNNGHSAGTALDQTVRDTLGESIQQVDYPKLLQLGRELLVALGEDPDREGLRDTPRRWANAWREFIEYDPGTLDTVFDSASVDQMVTVSGIRISSLCEHHLMPFNCEVAIGYIAEGKVLGLSKFARIAHKFAHRLQIQEQLGQQIADEISRITGTESVAVVIKGEHTCMSDRGIRTPGLMTTSVMRGVFRAEFETRMEFLRLIDQ